MPRTLESDIDWRFAQIERLNEAIALGEPAQTSPATTSIWRPKAGKTEELAPTLSGMREQLERYEQTLCELEGQRRRGD